MPLARICDADIVLNEVFPRHGINPVEGQLEPLQRAVVSGLESGQWEGLKSHRLTNAERASHRLRGEDMKSKMIWPICFASSGGTALPIWPYCSVRFPSKK